MYVVQDYFINETLSNSLEKEIIFIKFELTHIYGDTNPNIHTTDIPIPTGGQRWKN